MAHKRSRGLSAEAAADAYLREAAFTALNRFVALKMLEARKLVQECVSKGEDSSGFKEFTALAPGVVAVEDKVYRLYIETLFDEIGQEVKVLFDRRDVASLLWPDRQTLLKLLGILNAPELASVWAEDETIGWVYQYFNGDEERTKMRAESQAPRNSRELAVRNQFFTPRYVVQFLTDNTLGRTWYEMMQGETKLAYIDYLVRRPNEMFLADGESAPESEVDNSEITQEELLKQTVYVAFRAKKDPRDLRILDPACGSGHFLLYAFELLVSIYEEAWGDAESAAFTETGAQLRADYGSIEGLRGVMPELILRHNLHGVDIDPRAAQIAALALWIRAQRAYNQFEVDRLARPLITKTNIVVAEPMPGDAELVDEFAAGLKPAVLGDIFKKMVEEMKLAGELGSLLKIEESIAKAVKEAAKANQQGNLFAGKVESQDFWDTADEKIIGALGSFAESTAGSAGIRRQLFAGDAAQGVAFIELMRKRFDAVLMNPPFGRVVGASSDLLYKSVPSSAQDLFAAFVERWSTRLTQRGSIGAITGRQALQKVSLEAWRDTVFYGGHASISLLADLGYGVLDAVVEVALYVLTEGDSSNPLLSLDMTTTTQKATMLRRALQPDRLEHLNVRKTRQFLRLPGHPLLHSAPPELLRLVTSSNTLGGDGIRAEYGLETGDDFRYFRCWWETPQPLRLPFSRWTYVAKGGEYEPWQSNVHLMYDYRFVSVARRASNRDCWGEPGVTWTARTTSNVSFRSLPPECIPSRRGPICFAEQSEGSADAMSLLGFLSSVVAVGGMELFVGGGDSSVAGSAARDLLPAYVEALPAPNWQLLDIQTLASEIYRLISTETEIETDPRFEGVLISPVPDANQGARDVAAARQSRIIEAHELWVAMQREIGNVLGLSWQEQLEIARASGQVLEQRQTDSGSEISSRQLTKKTHTVDEQLEEHLLHGGSYRSFRLDMDRVRLSIASDLISLSVGHLFGRRELRALLLEPQARGVVQPEAPLPVLPASSEPVNDNGTLYGIN